MDGCKPPGTPFGKAGPDEMLSCLTLPLKGFEAEAGVAKETEAAFRAMLTRSETEVAPRLTIAQNAVVAVVRARNVAGALGMDLFRLTELAALRALRGWPSLLLHLEEGAV